MRLPLRRFTFLSAVLATLVISHGTAPGADLDLTLRHRVETAEGSGRYHTVTRDESWDPAKTAIIICDMWDMHHSPNAMRREAEIAPRLEQVLTAAREMGVTIIHAPSDCMDFYEGHAARERAKAAPAAANLPEQIGEWCNRIPAEERGAYPIDQSDGGEDDAPAELAAWAAKLEELGRNPKAPWKRQIDVLTIDADRDYISDRGDEAWNILEARGIDNVILAGVHANMCVLGRPFGLRQMTRNGKNVVLMRDMTDTMYNPRAWPFVSHFTGTDLIIEHIEKFVCPTITSDQLIGGEPLVFQNDRRPHVVMMIGEPEYHTNESLPRFASAQLGNDFRVTFVFADENDGNHFPGIEAVADADVLLISVRRRTLPEEQIQYVKDHVAAGKPVIGIRTASHAFALRKGEPPEGHVAWPEFDAEVFGGHYTNHHGNQLKATISIVAEQSEHPILANVPRESFVAGGSLYRTSPVNERAIVLMTGEVDDAPAEPVAWTFKRADGGRSFYTSLGHVDDFENPAFVQMLADAIRWALQAAPAAQGGSNVSRSEPHRGWIPIRIPQSGTGRHQKPFSVTTADEGQPPVSQTAAGDDFKRDPQVRDHQPLDEPVWFRCFVRFSSVNEIDETWGVNFVMPYSGRGYHLWWNGHEAGHCEWHFHASARHIHEGLNTLVVRVATTEARDAFLTEGPIFLNADLGALVADANKANSADWGKSAVPLAGTWQHRIGDDPAWTDVPLPAQFAAPTDAICEVK